MLYCDKKFVKILFFVAISSIRRYIRIKSGYNVLTPFELFIPAHQVFFIPALVLVSFVRRGK